MSYLVALDVRGRIRDSPDLSSFKIMRRADSYAVAHLEEVISHGEAFEWPNGLRLSGARQRVRCSRGLGDEFIFATVISG